MKETTKEIQGTISKECSESKSVGAQILQLGWLENKFEEIFQRVR